MNTTYRKFGLGLVALFCFSFVLWFWAKTSGSALATGGPAALIALGRLAGLTGVLLILGQVLLISRARFLEQLIGFDKATVYHRLNGILAAFVLLLHPTLIVLGYAGQSGNTPLEQYFKLLQWEGVLSAAIAFDLLLLIVAISAIRPLRKLFSYEMWHRIHLLVYVVILLAFSHQIEQGAELSTQPILQAFWIGLYVIAFGLLAYYRFIRPLAFSYHHRLKVEGVEKITPSAVSVRISGRHLDRIDYNGGQFMIWRFLQKGFWAEHHPFTISIEPGKSVLRLSAKGVGDFSRRMGDLQPGTKVIADGPLGIFTARRSKHQHVVLIAGGSGITPLRAMLPELLRDKKQVVLLYGNTTRVETMLADELRDLQQNELFTWHNVLSDEQPAGYEHGYIDASRIRKLAPHYAQSDIYLCGPPAMVKAVHAALGELKVPPDQVIEERFALG